MRFTSAKYEDLGQVTARVNRVTGGLEINPRIWSVLNSDYKDFVLYHEDGHLRLETADEFEVNKYAVDRFIETATLDNPDLEQRIVVLSDMLSPKGMRKFSGEIYSEFSADGTAAGGDMYGIGQALTGLSTLLPAIGIGSKARAKELESSAKTQQELLTAQSAYSSKKTTNQIIIISVAGGLLIVALVLYFTFKR
ncbi:MAG: hypothetical protein WCO63_01305 [Bacteroidota bacterium]